MSGMSQWWPLFQLRLQTPGLELRLPSDSDLDALASLAASGVHDPAAQPFAVPWTELPPLERARSVLQHHWSQRAAWKPERWTLDFAVVHDGKVVGTQAMSARDFAVLREVSTGSWLGRDYHGAGTGTEMRAAVLHLAFAGLNAQYATSGAFADNLASLGVSRKLGYAADGVDRQVSRGQPATTMRLRLDRPTWESTHTVPVAITGLEPCLPLLGLAGGQRDAG
jgi:RimJ/RimL family protein N-acetyltransferase